MALTAAFQTLGLAILLSTLTHLFTRPRKPNQPRTIYTSPLQYLTTASMLLTTLHTTLSLLHTLTTHPVLDALTRAARLPSTPLALTITATYWPLRALAPTLLARAPLPPLPLDLAQHALPALLQLVDSAARPPRAELVLGTARAAALFGAALAAYAAWVERCRARSGAWAYPLLGGVPGGVVGRAAVWAGVGGVMVAWRRVVLGAFVVQ